jgi:dihydrofolate reductase
MGQITIISAMGLNRVIGRQGDLPWRLPADLAHFKALTEGKPVVMGRLTYESMGRPLPRRPNIVLTRRSDYHPDGVEVYPTLDSALTAWSDAPEVMIIGGAAVYAEGLAHANCMQLTVVHDEFEGDVKFPTFEPGDWGVRSVRHRAADEKNAWPCSFYELRPIRESGLAPIPRPFPAGAVFP